MYKKRRSKVTPALKAKVLELLRLNTRRKEIMRITGLDKSTIYLIGKAEGIVAWLRTDKYNRGRHKGKTGRQKPHPEVIGAWTMSYSKSVNVKETVRQLNVAIGAMEEKIERYKTIIGLLKVE